MTANWLLAYLIVIAILMVGAAIQEWLAWRNEDKELK